MATNAGGAGTGVWGPQSFVCAQGLKLLCFSDAAELQAAGGAGGGTEGGRGRNNQVTRSLPRFIDVKIML